MANIRKSFNFRTGLQVDNDSLVVNANGLVGIGTSIPQNYLLGVYGDVSVTGLVTTQNLFSSGISTFNSDVHIGTGITFNLVSGNVNIGYGITFETANGYVSATRYYGDGSTLSNIVGYSTASWIVNVGGTGIHTSLSIGIGTTSVDQHDLLIGSDPLGGGEGITFDGSSGDINSTGIITATSFSGIITATDLAGTIDNARLPSSISVTDVTANSFIGTATAASSLAGTPNVNVGVLTASKVVANSIEVPNTGVTTVSKLLHVGTGGTAFSALEAGRIGVGTAVPTSELQIRKASGSLLEVISDTDQARISIGQSVGVGNSTGVLRFGNAPRTFDVINRDTGNINMILHGGGSGIGTGRFDWIYGQTNAELMSVTYDGKLGIGKTNPDNNLHVVGTSTVTGNSWFGGNVTIDGTLNTGTIIFPSLISANISTTSGISTFFSVNVVNDLLVDTDIGIGTTNPVVNFDARGRTALIGNLGINTTTEATASLEVTGQSLFDSIGIGTTNSQGEGIYNTNSYTQYSSTLTVYDGAIYAKRSAVGVGTTAFRSSVDFGDAGKDNAGGVGAFLIMPRISNSERTGLTTVSGAVIFNTDTNTFQGFDGTTWQDFH